MITVFLLNTFFFDIHTISARYLKFELSLRYLVLIYYRYLTIYLVLLNIYSNIFKSSFLSLVFEVFSFILSLNFIVQFK